MTGHDSFAEWGGPRVVPPTKRDTHRDLHGACERREAKLTKRVTELCEQLTDYALEAVKGRDTIAALEAERDRLRSELAECRAELLRGAR